MSDIVLPDYEPLDLPYSQWERRRSQELLAANGFGKTTAEWRRAARHGSGVIRSAALYLLTRKIDPEDKILFRQGLKDIDDTMKALAAYGAYTLGDKTALSTLREIARLDVDANLAAPRAAGLLAELGDPAAFASVKKAMENTHGYVRLSALQFLPAFVRYHGHSDGSGQKIDAWDVYCQALRDPDLQVQTVATMQLQELNSPGSLTLIEDCKSHS